MKYSKRFKYTSAVVVSVLTICFARTLELSVIWAILIGVALGKLWSWAILNK